MALSQREIWLFPAEVVSITHNIIFSQITARLDLDDLQKVVRRIFQAMPGAYRYVSRFIHVEQNHLIPARYARCALHHHPVFGALVMRLER